MGEGCFVQHVLIQNFLPFLFQDIQEYTLTNEFCRKHFLIGVLLREVGFALQEDQDIRHLALAVLKNLMAKHSFDDRYAEPVNTCVYSFSLFAHTVAKYGKLPQLLLYSNQFLQIYVISFLFRQNKHKQQTCTCHSMECFWTICQEFI